MKAPPPGHAGMFTSLNLCRSSEDKLKCCEFMGAVVYHLPKTPFLCSLLHLSYNLSVFTLKCHYQTPSKKLQLAVTFLGLKFDIFLFSTFVLPKRWCLVSCDFCLFCNIKKTINIPTS